MGKRVGLVGYGIAGRILHAPLLARAGFYLVAIVTNDSERRAHAQHDFPEAAVCSTMSELLNRPLDLVVVASNNNVHGEHVRAALSAAIPTVVDKPVAPSYTEVRELFELSAALNVPLTVFYNRLWDSDFLAIKEHSSLIAPIFRFESRYERWRPDLAAQSWREQSSESEGGGVLIDLHSHLVASALALFGPATLVHARVQSLRGGSNDDALLILEHESGVTSVLSASAISGAPGPRLRVQGRNGALTVENVDDQEIYLRAGRYAAQASPIFLHRGEIVKELTGVPGRWPDFYHQLSEFLDGAAQLPISPEFALSVAYILEEAKKYLQKSEAEVNT